MNSASNSGEDLWLGTSVRGLGGSQAVEHIRNKRQA